MSGLKPRAMTEFYSRLHRRGLSTTVLAETLDVSGAVVRRLLAGLRPRRGPTWRALLALLSAEEKQLLLSVEQCPTWNARQSRKRPVWTPEKAAEIAAAKMPQLSEA